MEIRWDESLITTAESGTSDKSGSSSKRLTHEEIIRCANPIITKIIAHKLGLYIDLEDRERSHPDAEDVYQAVYLKLFNYLDKESASAVKEIISVPNYVAKITHNVCNDEIRKRVPNWHRLNHCLQDLVRRNPEFSSRVKDGHTLIGLAKWKNKRNDRPTKELGLKLEEIADEFRRIKFPNNDLTQIKLSKLASQILNWLEEPVRTDTLVDMIVYLRGEKISTPESLDDEPGWRKELEDDMSVRIEGRFQAWETERALWSVRTELTLNQRRAFFLTTDDENGENLLRRLHRRGVATSTEIYRALEMPRDELKTVWGKLSLSMRTAADELDTNEENVSKLCHRARKRLSTVFGWKR